MAQRQISGCFNDNSDYITGATGIATSKWSLAQITGANPWKAEGKYLGMYLQEHKDLYDSIRGGAPVNDGEWMCQSTLAGIMGRMAAYTGQEVTWEHMLNSKENLFPQNLKWDMELPVEPMASPGRTKLI
jgi:hypothetical protein